MCISQPMVDYYAIKLLPLPVQSPDPREAAGYNGNFSSDQRQLAERNRSQLGRNWKYIANQLPLWWWQYSDVAIGGGCCGCNWCCSVAAREVGGTETTEAFPLIGLARGHGTCYRPRPLQPLQVACILLWYAPVSQTGSSCCATVFLLLRLRFSEGWNEFWLFYRRLSRHYFHKHINK